MSISLDDKKPHKIKVSKTEGIKIYRVPENHLVFLTAGAFVMKPLAID